MFFIRNLIISLISVFFCIGLILYCSNNVIPTAFADSSNYYVAKNGSDSNPGTEAQPWLTIQKAANTVTAGDTVYVKSGIYDERVTVSTVGSAQSPVTIQGYSTDRPVVVHGFRNQGRYITIKQFEVTTGATMADSPRAAIVVMKNSSNPSYGNFDDIYIHDLSEIGQYAVYGEDSAHATFQNIILKNWDRTTTHIIQPGDYGIFKNGTISWDNNSQAPTLDQHLFNLGNYSVIENNVLWGPFTGNGVTFTSVTGTIIRNNIFYKIGRPLNTATHAQTMGSYRASHDVTIEGNIMANAGQTWEEMGVTWEAAPMHIFLEDATSEHFTNIKIQNNIFLGYIGRWVHVKDNTYIDGLDVNNNFIDFGGAVINNATGVKIKNNIVGNGTLPTIGGFDQDYNLFWDDYYTNVPTGQGSNSIVGDPRFVNPTISAATRFGVDADWRLQAGSPAINAGIKDTYAPATDRLGNLRIEPYDIGPYEYDGAVSPLPADLVPPTVSITSPADNATVSGTTNIAVSASDNVSLSKVEFYVDNTLKATDTSSPYSYAMDTTSYTNGSYTIKAIAYDSSNLTGQASISVTVSNQSAPVPDGTNVALASNGGRVSSYSDQFDARGYASYLIDGKKTQFNTNYTGWWIYKPLGTEYATIELDNTYTVSQIIHYNDGQYGGKSVTVKYSTDNQNWHTLGTHTNLGLTSNIVYPDTFEFSPVQAKYFRFEYSSFNDPDWLQVDEIEIFSTSSGSVEPPAPADTTAPQVAITSPSSGTLTGSTKSITGTATDGVAIDDVETAIKRNSDNRYWTGSAWTTSETWLQATIASGDNTPSAAWNYSWSLPASNGGSYTIKARAKDSSNNIGQASSVTISVDNIQPTVSSITPSSGATGVSRGTAINVTFSESIDSSTVNTGTIRLAHDSSQISGTVSYDASSKTATFTPDSVLAYATAYVVTVTTGIKDTAGNSLSSFGYYFFTTETAPDSTSPTLVLETNPLVVDGSNGWFKTIPTIRLTISEPGTVYYSWISETGPWTTYSGLFNALSGQKTLYYYSSDVSGNVGTVRSTVFKVDASMPSSSISDPSASQYLNGDSYSILGLALDAGASGIDKVEISINSGAWTSTEWSNYWSYLWNLPSDGTYNIRTRAIDKAGNIETTGTGINVCVDNHAPSVSSTNPINGAQNVAVNSVISATFSEGMDSSSIDNEALILRDANGNQVSGTVTYSISSNKASFRPDVNLSYSATYTATLTTEAKDNAENPLASNQSWSFTTCASTSCNGVVTPAPSSGSSGGSGGGGGGGSAPEVPSIGPDVNLQPPSTSSGVVAGQVLNSFWQVIPNATITVDNINITYDSRDGHFVAGQITAGIHSVIYNAPGYLGQVQMIEIRTGETSQCPTCMLSPSEANSTISGRILDSKRHRPIPGASARIDNTILPTNAAGDFRFTGVVAGQYRIYYQAPHYRDQSQIIPVGANQNVLCPTVLLSR